MPQNKKETKEKKPKVNLTDDVQKKAEYPISNRESLQDYDALG